MNLRHHGDSTPSPASSTWPSIRTPTPRWLGIGHVTPHQLRHTYATALVNAGVSLQALMAILGHVSAEMSLRYGHLFDTTVRTVDRSRFGGGWGMFRGFLLRGGIIGGIDTEKLHGGVQGVRGRICAQ